MIEECLSRDKFLLGIAPEGTRSPVQHWKTGVWNIAHQTGIPIIPACIDYSHKTISIFEPFQVGDDMEHERQKISNFYRAEQAKNPQNFLSHQPD